MTVLSPECASLLRQLLDALKGMQAASEEIAVEFIYNKRATNWKIINDAYVACEQAIIKAEKVL